PDWTIAPGRGPSDVPALSTSSEADVNSLIRSAALAAAAGSMPLESPYSSLLSGSCTTGATFSGAACAVTAATTLSSRAPAGSGIQVSSSAGALGADSSSTTPST